MGLTVARSVAAGLGLHRDRRLSKCRRLSLSRADGSGGVLRECTIWGALVRGGLERALVVADEDDGIKQLSLIGMISHPMARRNGTRAQLLSAAWQCSGVRFDCQAVWCNEASLLGQPTS